jgi:DNA-binding NarL/FixJ family response regulator
VNTAKDGTEAILKYQEALRAGSPFNLFIMDLTIPGGMGGKETIEKLLKIDPSVKAIVSSGYSNDPVMADYKKYGFIGTITKPYRVEEVSKIIGKIINNN